MVTDAVSIWGFILLLLFPVYVVASPIPNQTWSRESFAFLGVIIALIFLTTSLVVLKYVYMKHRRIASTHSLSRHTSSTDYSFDLDPYFRSSVSVSYVPDVREGVKSKSGFLVGFFGSPSWETRAQLPLDKAGHKQQKPSSSIYRLHSRSSRHHSQGRRSSLHSSKNRSRLSGSGSVSIASVVDSRALYDIRDATGKRRSRRLWLPKYPNTVYSDSPDTSIVRRFSLPSGERAEPLVKLPNRKRHSSLKSARGIVTQLQETSLSRNVIFPGSVRLVDQETSVQYTADQNFGPLSLSSASSIQTKPKPRPSSKCVPPMPPLPVAVPISSFSQSTPNVRAPAPIRISRPYALAPKNNLPKPFSVEHSSRSEYDSKEFDFPVPRPLSLGDDSSASSFHDQPSANLRKPFANLISPLNVFPSDVGFSTAKISPPASLFPTPPACPPVIPVPVIPTPALPVSKAKAKLKRPSTRSKRISPVGPSPLRSMVLPEGSPCSESGSRSSDHIDSEKENLKRHVQPSVMASGNLGLGQRLNEQDGSSCNSASKNKEDRAADALLGIIRELVEETNEWDESLFVDDNFKSMIKNAGDVGESSLCCATASDTSGMSTEIDLGLLGLNRFIPDQDARDFELEGAKEDSATDLASFLDGVVCGWNEDDRLGSVGMAS